MAIFLNVIFVTLLDSIISENAQSLEKLHTSVFWGQIVGCRGLWQNCHFPGKPCSMKGRDRSSLSTKADRNPSSLFYPSDLSLTSGQVGNNSEWCCWSQWWRSFGFSGLPPEPLHFHSFCVVEGLWGKARVSVTDESRNYTKCLHLLLTPPPQVCLQMGGDRIQLLNSCLFLK